MQASCAAYLTAATRFFQSAKGASRRLHAAGALASLLRAQALDPFAMTGRQPTARLDTSWNRIGDVGAWKRRPPLRVQVPKRAGATAFVLRPADATDWASVCGDAPECTDGLVFALPPPALTAYPLTLRPGRYHVRLEGVCGEVDAVVEVSEDAPSSPWPALPACRVAVRGFDIGAPGEAPTALAAGALTLRNAAGTPLADALDAVDAAIGQVEFSAPGYVPTVVQLPSSGGTLDVTLARCPVRLRVAAVPPDAEVEGDAPGPWGLRTIRVSRDGYAPFSTSVNVPAPADCEAATWPPITQPGIDVALARPVSVAFRSADGEAVEPGRLWIDGAIVSPTGFVATPGAHKFAADHPTLPRATGEFTVRPCGDSPCSSASFAVEFPRRVAPGFARNTKVALGIGALLFAGGVLSGLAAAETDTRIGEFTNKKDEAIGIDELVDRRDQQAKTADGLMAVGALTAAGAMVWHHYFGTTTSTMAPDDD